MASEAAKGTEFWSALQEGREGKVQESEFVCLVDILIWNFFCGVLSFSVKMECVDEIWMKEGSEVAPIIGFSLLCRTLRTEKEKANEIRESRKQKARIASLYNLFCF